MKQKPAVRAVELLSGHSLTDRPTFSINYVPNAAAKINHPKLGAVKQWSFIFMDLCFG